MSDTTRRTCLVSIETPLDLGSVEAKVKEQLKGTYFDLSGGKVHYLNEKDLSATDHLELLRLVRSNKYEMIILLQSASAPFKGKCTQAHFISTSSFFVSNLDQFYLTRHKTGPSMVNMEFHLLTKFLFAMLYPEKFFRRGASGERSLSGGAKHKSFTVMNHRYILPKQKD